MRRTIATFTMLGLFGAALGCQHIGGKCDCGAHPSDAQPVPIGNPYPYAPVGGVVTVPQIPPATGNGKDAKVPMDMKDPAQSGNEGSKLPMLETEQVPTFKAVPNN